MVQNIEAFQPEQERSAFRKLDTILDKDCYVGGWSTTERRLADNAPVHDRAIIVGTVPIIVDASGGVEWAGGRKLCQGTSCEIER